jgi:hypothetical protein
MMPNVTISKDEFIIPLIFSVFLFTKCLASKLWIPLDTPKEATTVKIVTKDITADEAPITAGEAICDSTNQ